MYHGKLRMLPSPLFRNKDGEIRKRGFLCSHVPGGSDLGLFVPGPFLLALSFPWFPGDWHIYTPGASALCFRGDPDFFPQLLP